MKKSLIIVSVIVVALLGFLYFSSPKSEAPKTDTSGTSEQTKLSFSQIQSEVEQGSAYLLDVRTPEEYAAGHFANAINFDSVKIDAGQTPDLAKDAKIYVYCRSGNRSTESVSKLKAAGYTNLVDLEGLADVEAIGGKLIK